MTTTATPDRTERLERFRQLVATLRSEQRNYFRTRTGLDTCRRLEKAVDAELERLEPRQPALFPR